eukprot:15278741-Heterocapsa_arctica.AAC.2
MEQHRRRLGITLPTDRAQERLLLPRVASPPPPPAAAALARARALRTLHEAVGEEARAARAGDRRIVIATDGAADRGRAAWAVSTARRDIAGPLA